MRAGYYVGDYTYEVREVPDPEPKADEVKVRVAWCGLCGTDIHKFQGKNGSSVVIPPVVLGHEVSGVVEAVGPDCKYFKPGDRVAVDPNWGCGKCEWCQRGLPHFCVERHGVSKGFADYVCPPESNVYHIPDELDLENAAFAEPLSCVIHGFDLIHMKAGKTVVIYGMGSVGAIMLQLVKATGAARIIVVEREPEKREAALKMGASLAVTDAEIEAIAEQENFDYVIECIGIKSTMEQAIHVAGKNAKVLLFGLGDPDQPVSFNQYEAFTKEVSIYTSYLNAHVMDRAIALLATGIIDTRETVSARLELEDMGDELANHTYSRKGKVLIRLSGAH